MICNHVIRLTLCLILCTAFVGCSSSRGDSWGRFTGPEPMKWNVRAAVERAYEGTGCDKRNARKHDLVVNLYPGKTQTASGWQGDDPNTGARDVHGVTAHRGGNAYSLGFAVDPNDPNDLPNQWVVNHESAHVALLARGITGHPEEVVGCDGGKYRVQKAIQARWPARAARWCLEACGLVEKQDIEGPIALVDEAGNISYH